MRDLLRENRPRVLSFSLGACCLLILLLFPAALIAQQAPVGAIKSVEFSGLDRLGAEFARGIAGVRIGDPVDVTLLDQAVVNLLGTGRFLSASYTLAREPDGVRVRFTVRQRLTYRAVRFEGNSKFTDTRLADQVGLKVGQAVDEFVVRDGRDTISALYRGAGYSSANVTVDLERIRKTGEVVYVIDEGLRTRIREIAFEGNTAFDERVLKRLIRTKKSFWVFRTGAFDKAVVEADAAALQRLFRDRGFLDARVTFRREPTDKPGDLRVVFVIAEGTRYAIESIDLQGNTVFSAQELRGIMASREGETVSRTQIDRDVRTIGQRYGELGYLDATARAIRVFSDTPGLVRITIDIKEGSQFRVGRVVVRGNTRTKDKVVRRALNLYPPDDLFNRTETREAERRLRETQVFSSARVLAIGNTPGVRDAVIDVQEAEKAGDFLFGAGVTSNSGLIGTIVLDLKNFDINDRPRTLAEFMKFRSFFGGGQHFRLELQPGTSLSRFRVDFTEPYLFDKPIRFDVSGYLFQRGRDGYRERRAGTTVSLGKRFERGRLTGWTGEVALRVEGASARDLDLFAARKIRESEGTDLLTSVKLTMVRDRTDSRFLPTTGDRFRVSYEQFGVFGGDHGFGKLTMRHQTYRTIKTDSLERKSVLRLKAEGGAILGDAPVYERFHAGGTGSIRGFRFRGVGERAGLEDNNIGGDFLVLLGAEYSYPLIGENIRGHFFLDTGTAGSGTYRASVGVGLRLILDLLGPIPLEFNVAFPVATGNDDEEEVFSFLMGSLF